MCAVRLSECHTIDENRFLITYHIKHKPSKSGFAIAFRGYCIFIKRNGSR